MTTAEQKKKRIAGTAGTIRTLAAREKKLTDDLAAATSARIKAEARHKWLQQMPVDDEVAPVAGDAAP